MAEKLTIPSRDELIRRWERDYLLRNPAAKIGKDTLPGIHARVSADQLLPLYAEAARLGGGSDLDNIAGVDLENEAEDLGLPRRLPAVGASGAVTVTTVVGGETILAGLQCKDQKTGLRYQCSVTGLYLDGAQVPVSGIDTGPSTDVAAGTILQWTSPPAGLGPTCTVVAQSNGSGLSGGRTEELDEDIRDRIRAERSEPALAGNAAEYRAAAIRTPGLSIQAVFSYSAVLGPGTIGIAFTMLPGAPGSSRRPNATQIAAVRAHLIGQMPADDGLFMYVLLDDPIDLALKVRWSRGSVGWADPDPWPLYSGFTYYVTAAASPTVFSIAQAQPAPAPPRAGQTIAFWNAAKSVFVRKKIKSFTGTGTVGDPFVITAETANNASDTTYTPQFNDRPGPWSDALAGLATPVLAEFDKLGPGDHTTFDTGGLRRRREPTGFEAYPYELSGRLLVPIYSLPAVDDVQVAAPVLPRSTPTGTYGTSSYLTSLRYLAVYPL